MRFIPILAAMTIGLFATAATAQNMNTRDPNSAPGASTTGGQPVPVNPAEVRRDNTADPNSAPRGRTDGGRVNPNVPLDPAGRANTKDPG